MVRSAMGKRPERVGQTLTVVLAVFALSRIALWAAGVRFDASTLTWYFQYIDPVLLKGRLFESLLYLHSQPPGFNLALGLALKLSPVHFAAMIHGGYVVLGGTATVCLYLLARRLGVPNLVAAVLAILFAVAPATLLYENWLFYTYPTMCLLVMASLLFHQFVGTGSSRYGTAFFFTAAALIYLRAIFQLVWLIPVLAVLVRVLGVRKVARCAAVPLALILVLYAKNLVMFGSPTTSSWLGMNLSRVTVFRMTEDSINQLVDSGALHEVARVGRFKPLDLYAGRVPPQIRTGHPVLDTATKTGGEPNFNHLAYVTISREFLTDSLWVIRNKPEIYVRSIVGASRRAFRPSTDYFAFDTGNRAKVARYDNAVNNWALLTSRWSNGVSLTTLVAYGVAMLYAHLVGWRTLRRRFAALGADEATVLFMAFTAVYVLTVSVMTEIGENQRMRFVLDPLIMVIVALALSRRGRLPSDVDVA